jgi:transportin-3
VAFESLFNDDLFESAVDFITAMFAETSDVRENEPSIEVLYDEVKLVSPRLGAIVADPDSARGVVRLYSEAGEAWVSLIVGDPRRFIGLVQIIAQCTAYKDDLDVARITFNFWYQLTLLVTLEKYRIAKATFTPIYAGLVDTMIAHLHYPPGNDREDMFNGDREAEEKFRNFRHEMGGVLKDCCRVVGGTQCLARAFDIMGSQLARQAAGENVQWQDIEAPLFSMRVMAREVDTDDTEHVPVVMTSLVHLPEHDKIRYAATLVLGRYTEWTAKHPEYLESQLNYISSGFQNHSNDVMSAAAQALKYFCQDCKHVNLCKCMLISGPG